MNRTPALPATFSFITLTLALAVTLASTPGCAAPVEDEVDTTHDALRGGAATTDLPAVGKIVIGDGMCTGTLIAPRAVLTSAHCFDHGDNQTIGTLSAASFEITPEGGGTPKPFAIDSFYARDAKVFGGGATDVALLHLTTAVPASLARPIAIASRGPRKPERVYQLGYGCQSRKDPSDTAQNPLFGQKQMVSFLWGSDHEATCPGDSGGPTLLVESTNGGWQTRVFRVTKGYREGLFGGDIFASVLPLDEELAGVIATWDAR